MNLSTYCTLDFIISTQARVEDFQKILNTHELFGGCTKQESCSEHIFSEKIYMEYPQTKLDKINLVKKSRIFF